MLTHIYNIAKVDHNWACITSLKAGKLCAASLFGIWDVICFSALKNGQLNFHNAKVKENKNQWNLHTQSGQQLWLLLEAHNILSLVYFALFVQSINESISLLRENSHPAQLIGFYDTRNAVHSTYFKWLGNRINGTFEVFLSSAHTPSVGNNKSEILYWLSFITAQWQQEMKWN